MAVRAKDYALYLRSDHWAWLKSEKYKQIGGHKCQRCGSSVKLHVHHMRYKQLIDCTIDDLSVLCQECHAHLHDALKAKMAKPEDYASIEAIHSLLDWYFNTPNGEIQKQRRAIRAEKRAFRRSQDKGWKKACRKMVNAFRGRAYSHDGLRIMIQEAERLLKEHPEQ